MTKRACIGLIAIFSVVSLSLGYWIGTQKVRGAIVSRFVDELFRESVEAKHDGALVHLLNEKKYHDAQNLAQVRYYGRVILLAEMNSFDSAASPEAAKAIAEAKGHWQKDRYVMPDAKDNVKLLKLMR